MSGINQDERLPFRMVGLTGGIASGKSTVSRMLRARGLEVIDADLLARAVVEPGRPALAEIAEAFGEDVLDDEGRLRRARLGEIVFGDDEARATLNAITHPRIAMETASRVQEARERGEPLVVYDAPLIVENGLQDGMDLLIVVSLDVDTQRERLMDRDEISAEAASERIASQLPLSDKVAVADVVIDNGDTLEATEAQVEALVDALPQRLWPQETGASARFKAQLNSSDD